NAELQHVLNSVIYPQGMAYKIISETIIITLPKTQFAHMKRATPPPVQEEVVVTGTVTDASGESLAGATVSVKNQANIGTKTDAEGSFTLRVPKNATIQVSYIGYLPKEVTVT